MQSTSCRCRPGRRQTFRMRSARPAPGLLTIQRIVSPPRRWRRPKPGSRGRVSPKAVHRVWQTHGFKPHRTVTFQLSRDPQFVEKLTAVVRLCLNPPDKALLFCADEKSQIQALDRTQLGLPLKKGHGATMTHDSKRHGTTTLFAALNVLTSKLIGTCQCRHRHQEWLRFPHVARSAHSADPAAAPDRGQLRDP
jgi:hypothetical protein